jgi:hypothetical protein
MLALLQIWMQQAQILMLLPQTLTQPLVKQVLKKNPLAPLPTWVVSADNVDS